MSNNYSRPLYDHEAIEVFLGRCLQVGSTFKSYSGQSYESTSIINKIRNVEGELAAINAEPTLSSKENRHRKYREDNSRKELREQILTELIQKERLDSDDEIELGNGGAKPKASNPKTDSQAYFVIGLPASGKSTLVNNIADKLGAMIIDSDFAKRKIPEYGGTPVGANIVHEESKAIIFGGANDEPCLFEFCIKDKYNMVLPMIGHNYIDLLKLRNSLIKRGYKVHLSAVVTMRGVATLRALNRFLETGRYVPLGLIFDGYANDPILNYYKSKSSVRDAEGEWASFGAISDDGYKPPVIDFSSEENPVSLMQAQERYSKSES